jgi:hypothetical protein
MLARLHSLHRFAFPLALLGLLILAFGLLIPTLGFYWDDWPVLLTHRLLGNDGLWQFYTYDRPISAWTYVVTLPLLGYSAPAWHIFTLLLRWATCLGLWLTLRGIWPHRAREAALVTTLFAIYPIFIQQPIAIAYSQHWITYLLFFISLAAMVYAVRRPRLFWPLTVLALVTAALHLATMEYFAGLELVRLPVLWLLSGYEQTPTGRRLKTVLLRYVPYLVVLLGFLAWRLFWLELPGEDVNRPLLLFELLENPLSAGVRLLQVVLQDGLHALFTAWTRLLDPAGVTFDSAAVLLSWLVAGLGALTAFTFFTFYRRSAPAEQALDRRWHFQAMALGLFVILVGMLPVWLSDRQMIAGFYANRFGLPAMFGAALFWVGLLDWLVISYRKQFLIVSVMVGLAVGLHLQTANDYRWSWALQQRFYWQLHWRAPAIEPGTAIYSDGELFPYVGWYSTAAGINLLYPEEQTADLNYWFFSLGREIEYRLEDFQAGMPLSQGLRIYRFEGQSQDGLVLHFDPVNFDCVAILELDDDILPDLPDITRKALVNSNLARILNQPGSPPDPRIFGPEPERGWCYFYQKAALAQQYGEWEEVVRLGDGAQSAGFRPRRSSSNTAHEWLPFIEGYARAGHLDRAASISRQVLREDDRIQPRLCRLWQSIAAQVEAGAIPAGFCEVD